MHPPYSKGKTPFVHHERCNTFDINWLQRLTDSMPVGWKAHYSRWGCNYLVAAPWTGWLKEGRSRKKNTHVILNCHYCFLQMMTSTGSSCWLAHRLCTCYHFIRTITFIDYFYNQRDNSCLLLKVWHLFEKDWQHINCRHLLSILSRAERYSKGKYCNLLTVTEGFYYWRHKNAPVGSRKFCNQITRKQLLMNTKVKEHSLSMEQRERGMTGDFLTLVTKDQRHEYLTCCYQLKSVKVWQVSLMLDEQSFF